MRSPFLLISLVLVLLLGVYTVHSQRGLLVAGTGWAAKRVCSGVFVAGRTQDSLSEASLPLPVPFELQATVDYPKKRVTSRIISSFLPASPSFAQYRSGLGCTLERPGNAALALDSVDVPFRRAHGLAPPPTVPIAAKTPDLEKALDWAFERSKGNPEAGLGTRAIVVLHDGAVVAERYAEGFSASTPLPGWSMAKSVTSAMVGLLAKQGRLDIMDPVGLKEWSAPDDPRAEITWDQLLRMSSGLSFSENYALPSSDAIQMLFGLERFAKGRYAATRPLEFEPNTHWSYSSGTSNVLQYAMLQRVFDGEVAEYLAFPHEALFAPIGMASAVLEPDANGTFVGSSFLYATAQDWARFGLLYLEQGQWNGEEILSQEWIRYTSSPTVTEPRGTYGAHWWLNADPKTGTRRMPSLDPNILIASGFEGQFVVVVPNHDLVVVRLGLDRGNRLDIERLTAQIVAGLASESGP